MPRSRSSPPFDLPLLHPRFVAAVCRGLGGRRRRRAAPRRLRRQPLAAAYRSALAPLVAELVESGQMKPAFLFERCETRWLEELPNPESVRNLNTRADYEAALAEPEPLVSVRGFGRWKRPRSELRAATLGTAAAAIGVTLDEHAPAALNGDQIARDPLEPLVEGDEVALMAADAGG